MKILCKKNTIKGVDLKEVTTFLVDEYNYELEIGKEYLVMGIMTPKDSNCIYYLTDHNGSPFWYPYLLFDITDNTIPKNWYILILNKNGDGTIFTLIGFDELCNDDDFHDALMERDEQAMLTYFKRRIEMENDVY